MLRWLLRMLFGKKDVCAIICNRTTLRYHENGRTMTIAGEMLVDGFEIYVASIVSWDDTNGELIDEPERRRILDSVKQSLETQGARVALN